MLLPEQTTVRVRPKNQVTVPEPALAAVGAAVGSRFLVTVEDGAIRLEPVLGSYAGVLRDVYADDWAEELRRDREAWGR